jgi:hypothetical protein
VTIISICGVNSSINPNRNYHNNTNGDNNNPFTILIATDDEETGNRNNDNLDSGSENTDPYVGVNVRGLYPGLQHERYPYTSVPLPADYYNNSIKLISEADMNHIPQVGSIPKIVPDFQNRFIVVIVLRYIGKAMVENQKMNLQRSGGANGGTELLKM